MLALLYPALRNSFGFNPKQLRAIPTKSGNDSGYLLIAIIGTVGRLPGDKYACFTNQNGSEVWIERLSILSHKEWFCFDDLTKIDNNEEFNEVLNFLKHKKILD